MPPVIPEFDALSSSVAEQAAALEEHGAVILHNLHEAKAHRLFYEEAQKILDPVPVYKERGKKDLFSGFTKRSGTLIADSLGARELLVEPKLLSLIDEVLQDQIQLHCTGLFSVGAGARDQTLHREEDPFNKMFKMPRPKLVVATMTAVTEFTKANGGTLIVPGSHKWARGRKAKPEEITNAVMPKGSTLFWMGGTLHGAGANTTDPAKNDWRQGLFASYSLGWLRTEENQMAGIPREQVADLSPTLKSLCGYTEPYAGTLGIFDNRKAGFGGGKKEKKEFGLQNLENLPSSGAPSAKL